MRSHPWPEPSVILWALLSGIGVTLVAAGWLQVRNETVYADQAAGINMAIVGVIAAGSAAVSMLLAGRRGVAARRLAVLGDLRAMPSAKVSAGSSGDVTSQSLVGGEGLRHFHRAGCTMAQGRNWSAGSRPEHEQAGRVPCGVCRP